MTRAQLKSLAKEQLGGGIFSGNWIFAIIITVVASIIISATGFTFIVPIIIAGPLAYGLTKLFLKQSRDGQKMEFGNLFDGFKEDFLGNFLLYLMMAIFICLWSLLLYIPGIIKAFAYSQAFYIKADHPEYGWKQCLDESQQMMKGHKWELFVLNLSFIGWIIVGSIACGVGVLWVEAYMSATQAQFYRYLKGEIQ